MKTSTQVTVLTQVAVIASAVLTLGVVVIASTLRPDPIGIGVAAFAIGCLAIPVVGAAAARAQPRNAVGWVVLVGGVALPLCLGSYLYAHAAFADASIPHAVWAGWLDGWPWTIAATLPTTVGLLLFPTGRVTSRRTGAVLVVTLLVIVAQLINELFAPHLLDFSTVDNPTAAPGRWGTVADMLGLTIVLVPALVTLAALSVHRRWRRALTRSDEAAALRLVAPAAWVVAGSWWACIVVTVTTGNSNYALPVELLALMALAVASWVAIRRFGLFDARYVLSRALVYGALSVVVIGVYLAVAAVTESVASSVLSAPIAVAVAVVVALPLQGVLRRWASRAVYGDRDDPYRAIATLRSRIEASAPPDEVLPGVVSALRTTLRLRSAEIVMGELSVREGAGSAREEVVPLIFAGETVGELRLGMNEPGESLTAGESRLVAGLAGQIAAAAHAVSLSHDLRRAHESLVASTEEERRRVSRDLHDGLGSRLAGLVLGLNRARSHLGGREGEVEGQLEQLSRDTQDAISEVRRLIYDLRPPALDELGLVEAVREQARPMGAIFVTGPAARIELPAAVEVAAYRIAMEAMTNVTRHSGATSASIAFDIDDDSRFLTIEVADDGVGMPLAFRAGVGIASMRERAAGLGGDCVIAARDTGGTVVRANLPLVATT